ncbi:MAG: glutamine amidotransferase-related protein [Roseiflexaceae bacterium]
MQLILGIIGDYDANFPPHQATDAALQHAAAALGPAIAVSWLPTESLGDSVDVRLQPYDALWCAPGSPYMSMQGALNGIRYAREHRRPFLGTCGGFQHVVIEYARNVLGFADAEHAENDPYASRLFISALSCSLAGKTMQVDIDMNSRVYSYYQQARVEEQYYCNFGLNPAYQSIVHDGGLRVVGVDQDQEARILELPDHPFFVATLFVPQLTSTPKRPHPLIVAYLRAAIQREHLAQPAEIGSHHLA